MAQTAHGSAWSRLSTGGWTGDGCTGGFAAAWVSGNTTTYDDTYTWWFATGLSSATCAVSVYVPRGDSTTVGGHPARYQVLTGADHHGANGFQLDQVDNHGSWLGAGSYPATGGYFAVRLTDEGSGSHQVAASAVRVDCAAT